MINSLPEYSMNELSGSHIDQLGQFENVVDEARKKGIISVTPKDEHETFDLTSQRIRIQTFATQLWLMGYLPKKIKPKRIDKHLDSIKAAVANFQLEAGLKQDNWVGDKTWYALDELVSFESDLTFDQWFENGQIKPLVKKAVNRAAQLRLWSLGLFNNKPEKKNSPLKSADLENFTSILKIFMVKPENFVAELNYESINILFDQDRLTKAIVDRSSKSKDSFLLNLPESNKNAHLELARRFIVNCAKIELWLLGYKVQIDGENDFEISKGSDLYRAISLYYQHFENRKTSDANRLAEKITPTLFQGIGAAMEETDDYQLDDASEEIAQELDSTEAINDAWSYLKEKGIRLWDGLKRIWKWIKKIGKKVVHFVKENIFKGFFQYVSKAYKILIKGMSAVAESIVNYVRGGMISPGLYYGFSKDMDSTVFFRRNITVDDINSGTTKILNQSKAFNVACRIVFWIFRIFKNLTSGFIGWARFLFSLLKGYNELRALYLDFKAVAVG